MGRTSKRRNLKKLIKSCGEFHEQLQAIGFSNYSDYLSSDHWLEVRQKYDVRSRKCAGCDRPAVCIHHVTYTNLGNEDLEVDFLPLCFDCHDLVHELLKESKKSVEWTVWALRKLFGWTREYTKEKFDFAYVPGKKFSVLVGKI
jgi:hypothetical protein